MKLLLLNYTPTFEWLLMDKVAFCLHTAVVIAFALMLMILTGVLNKEISSFEYLDPCVNR